MLQFQKNYVTNPADNSGNAGVNLTPRELEVLQLVTEGETNVGIGKKLFISVKTVQKHRQNIMNKLGIHDAIGLARYAISKGITRV
jgi:two-component system response regulator NreC